MVKSQRRANWLSRQIHDPYNQQARKKNLRSRAWFKLQQICERFRSLTDTSGFLVDLGSTPGGWSQYLRQHASHKCRGIIACDLVPMQPIPGVDFVLGDFLLEQTLEKLAQRTEKWGIGAVFSDMSPDLTGCKTVDQANAMILGKQLIKFCKRMLRRNGTLTMKAFQGENFSPLLQALKSHFTTVSSVKPAASRSISSEVYLIGQGFIVNG